MSTSSDNSLPNLNGNAAKQVIPSDWNEFAAVVTETSRDEFAAWLDDELSKLESELEQFVTSRSRYSGRR